MSRRLSGTPIEEDADVPISAEANPGDGDGATTLDSSRNLRVEVAKESDNHDRRKEDQVSPIRSRHSGTFKATSPSASSNEKQSDIMIPLTQETAMDRMEESRFLRRSRLRSPWSCSLLTHAATTLSIIFLMSVLHSFTTRQIDPQGCGRPGMYPAYLKLTGFDTEHTRFACKYSLHLYREDGVDEYSQDSIMVKGVPVLFIPGNAGSYKQVRSLAAEAATHFHDVVQHDQDAIRTGTRSLDFFTLDFNEDLAAFHGQTLIDQAEYVNEAVAYILSLYHDPRRSKRDYNLPDPSSVILVGHSMGGIVARTSLTMSNYQSNSINTIITMSAPHARPPVSFDPDMVHTYKQINDYWRQAYAQRWASNNPLWHVTLISIAGGGGDTVVPSDYASLSSLVPDTHGFTVFTSTIPGVWTGMDHLAITWCDQFRKVIIRSLFEVVDVRRSAQTRPRAERMRIFKKWYLTGMEAVVERTLPHRDPTTLLTLDDNANSVISRGKRLILRDFGRSGEARANLLPVPPQSVPGKKFTLLSDQKFDLSGGSGKLEVLFCSVFPLQSGHSATLLSMNMDLSGNSSGSTQLGCKNAVIDRISLPASTRSSKYPFEDVAPFSYLQYDLEDLSEHQFVAVVDKAIEPTDGWVVAEFSDSSESLILPKLGLGRLLTAGLHVKLPASRPMVTEIRIPALHSSLLAYKLKIGSQGCGGEAELFTPLLRQYLTEPYESKYFVNVKEANINLHGLAPFMPPPLRGVAATNGISLQLWSDPSCDSSMDISLKVDVLGSMGKLYMRYRTVFASFPLLVVALVLRKQFKTYDDTGFFITFAESLDLCLRSSLPLLLLAMTFLATSITNARAGGSKQSSTSFLPWRSNATESAVDYTKNDLLLGSQDSIFWFLVPLFGLVSIGVCVAVNYAALIIIHVFAVIYSFLTTRTGYIRNDDRRNLPSAFVSSSPRRRIINTSVLLLLVSTVIPYQFAYVVACIVQLATCTRALRHATESRSVTDHNFYNYAHSILILMLWLLPINIPVLVVWVHNLAVHWLTPFSSHHNVLSIMPFILLVETLTSGTMVPRVYTRFRYITNLLFFSLAVYATVYGVTYAYLLHHLVNLATAWLVAIHFSTSGFSLTRLSRVLEGGGEEIDHGEKIKKRP